MTRRAPDSAEQAAWLETRATFAELEDNVRRTGLKMLNNDIAAEFCKEWFFPCPYEFGNTKLRQAMTSKYLKIVNTVHTLRAALDAAEDGELGIELTPDGDINLVTDDIAHPEAYDQYRLNMAALDPTLSGFPIVIALVVIIIIGAVITTIAAIEAVNNALDVQLEKQKAEADNVFCQDPTSDVCQAWLKKRETSGYNENESFLDKLFGKGAGKAVLGGAGIAIAIALGIWAFSQRKSA